MPAALPPVLSDAEKKELRRLRYEKERNTERDIILEHRRLTAALEERKKVRTQARGQSIPAIATF